MKGIESSLDRRKSGLRKLIKGVCSDRLERLDLTHKDRLLRFGAEVVILNAKEESSFEDDLVQDVLEIITVFSARLYGARSRKNRKLLEALQEAAHDL